MAINVSDFESVDEINDHYAKKIRRAEPDEVEGLERERDSLRVSFREKALLNQQLDLAKQQALVEFPLAKDFDQFLNAQDPAKIRDQAKALHDQQQKRLDEAEAKVRAELEPSAARTAYGAPGAGGSGTPPPNQVVDDAEKLKEKVRSTLQRGDAPTKMDVYAFTGTRMAEAMEAARFDPSYRSSADRDRKVADARSEKRGGKSALPKV